MIVHRSVCLCAALLLAVMTGGLAPTGPAAAQHRGVTVEAASPVLEQLDLGRAYALIIGNNQYRNLPVLQTAVSDAAAVAELLRSRYEFSDVRLLLNATRADILNALNRYRRDLEPEDRLLIYYAGHGHLDREAEQGYWLPVDADQDLIVNWISNASITDFAKAMVARHVMIVADSCYSGALTRSGDTDVRSAPGGDRLAWLTRVAARRARTALVSGGLEPVVDGGRNGHSVFAGAFLSVLRENKDLLDGQSLFDRLKGRVVASAEQTPSYRNIRHAYHEGGDFIFAPKVEPAGRSTSRVEAAPQPCMLAWQAISGSRERLDFEVFLRAFPNCPMAPFAEARLAGLKPEERVAAVAAPERQGAAIKPGPTPQTRPAPQRQQIAKLSEEPASVEGRWKGVFKFTADRGRTFSFVAEFDVNNGRIGEWLDASNVEGWTRGPADGWKLDMTVDPSGKIVNGRLWTADSFYNYGLAGTLRRATGNREGSYSTTSWTVEVTSTRE